MNQDEIHLLPTGRQLAFRRYGDLTGQPVLYFHGWPGSRLEGGLFHSYAQKNGIQLIPVERPGYGLPRMMPHQRMLVHLARRVPGMARFGMTMGRLLAVHYPRLAMKVLLNSGLGKPDVQALSRMEPDGAFVLSMQESMRPGIEGLFGDGMRFLASWEFALSDIRCPVHLWHGDADRIVPIQFGRHLARQIPACEARWLPGEGHFSVPFNFADDIFDYLAPT